MRGSTPTHGGSIPRDKSGETVAGTPQPVNWRTSTYSGSDACVEVAHDGRLVYVRDSKSRTATLRFGHPQWTRLLHSLR
ncbi:DUF397 domain-containing protein [Solwaraspora sp. WMMA2056]|nr:DUF397 domain-containing protein [Solwaraspora sp. WMMA2056]WJK43915.1 DUF397 domain-containing protein [Solwaraspora sp. WMMA2056]